MDYFLDRYGIFRDKKFLISLGTGLLFFFASVVFAFFAVVYATEKASSPVTDVILNNIPVFDVDGIFVYGPVIFWALVIGHLVSEPRKIPFALKSIALFLAIRSVFISLTHIGPFLIHDQINAQGLFGELAFSGSDLFFSGHTGLPFLMALVLWDNKHMRLLGIVASVFFGIVVLLAHVHYSIDVLGAFFITYSIFHIARTIFKEDAKFPGPGMR